MKKAEKFLQEWLNDVSNELETYENAFEYTEHEVICILKAYRESFEKAAGITPECECKEEWLFNKTELDCYPYGANVNYDKCSQCGKFHNFKTI